MQDFLNDILTVRFVVIVIIFCFIGVVSFFVFCSFSFKHKYLSECYSVSILPDDYIYIQFELFSRKCAKKMLRFYKDGDVTFYYNKIRDRLKPLVFRVEADNLGPLLLFSYDFIDYVDQFFPDCRVRDFFSVLSYFVHFNTDLFYVNNTVSDEYMKALRNDVVNDVMASDEGQLLKDKYLKEHVLPDMVHYSDIEKDQYYKRLLKLSYNCMVKDIKLQNGSGLFPVMTDGLTDDILLLLRNNSILTHPELMALCDHKYDKGCLILYDTYDDVYYIVVSLNMCFFIQSCFKKPESDNGFIQAINNGHYFLGKFIAYDSVCFKNIKDMSECLYKAYCAKEIVYDEGI